MAASLHQQERLAKALNAADVPSSWWGTTHVSNIFGCLLYGEMHFPAANHGAQLGRGAPNPDLFLDPALNISVLSFCLNLGYFLPTMGPCKAVHGVH